MINKSFNLATYITLCILLVSCSCALADTDGHWDWAGKGQYRIIVEVPARDLNGRENDQAPAKIMLDIEIISPPLCETNTIDADSIEVVAYDPDTGWFSSAWWPIVPEGYPEWHYDLSLVSLDANTWAIRATSLNSVPEPATMFLLAVGAVALRSRRRQS